MYIESPTLPEQLKLPDMSSVGLVQDSYPLVLNSTCASRIVLQIEWLDGQTKVQF